MGAVSAGFAYDEVEKMNLQKGKKKEPSFLLSASLYTKLALNSNALKTNF